MPTYHFEARNLRKLGSMEIVVLSNCWREDKVTMVHRLDQKVDLALTCEAEPCDCAQALSQSRSQIN